MGRLSSLTNVPVSPPPLRAPSLQSTTRVQLPAGINGLSRGSVPCHVIPRPHEAPQVRLLAVPASQRADSSRAAVLFTVVLSLKGSTPAKILLSATARPSQMTSVGRIWERAYPSWGSRRTLGTTSRRERGRGNRSGCTGRPGKGLRPRPYCLPYWY